VRELPDWGKLIFKEQPPSDLAAAVPGTPPEAVQLLSGLLQYNPDHRLTAKQALQSPYFRAEPLPAPPRVMLGIVKGALARGSVRRAGADAASPPAVC
jgi:serine/threonine protein kinase